MEHSLPVVSEPHIHTVLLEMPVRKGRCWYVDWGDSNYQTVAACAYQILPSDEFDEGVGAFDLSAAMQFWCSRMALRQSLSRYTGYARLPHEWKLCRSDMGKLIVANPCEDCKHLDFSISHVPGLAACAVSSDAFIGVDLEPVKREFDSTLICSRIFSHDELETLRLTNKQYRSQLALRLWTLKEACSKAAGLGMGMDYSRIELALCDNGGFTVKNIALSGRVPACSWRVNQCVLDERYILSLSGATPVTLNQLH